MTTEKKPKRGRPSLGRDARQVQIIVRITANERAAWLKLAKAEGLALGPWLLEPRRQQFRKD